MRLNGIVHFTSVLQLVRSTSVHAESGDPRVEEGMRFIKCFWSDYNFNPQFLESIGLEGVFENYQKCFFFQP